MKESLNNFFQEKDSAINKPDGRSIRYLLCLVLLAVFVQFSCSQLQAQIIPPSPNPVNPWLYTNQAATFGSFGTPHDPVSLIMPATAYAAGLGSYLDNPASAALFGISFAEFGFNTRAVTEEAAYRSVIREHEESDFQNSITNAGFVYAFPVDVGRFVAGAGYMQFDGFNRAVSARSNNIFSSITDYFKWPGGIYSAIAFNTFATDFGDEFQDWDESIFRIGFDNFGEFPGISQNFTITERGYSGEYSVFAATEFRRNLMAGISVGWVRGSYRYGREFLEIDAQNNFDGEFIDTTGDGEPDTDIDRVQLEDRLSITFGGIRIRAGLLYRITPFINVGLSYTPSSTFRVNEDLDAVITTRMNNRFRFEEATDLSFSYQFRTPSKTSIGLALDRFYGFSLSLAADYVNFSSIRLDYRDGDLLDEQVRDNEEISEFLQDVWNFRAGITYDVNPFFTLRGGYEGQPGRFEADDGSRRVFSLGAGFIVTSRILFDMAFRNETWEEVSSVYDFIQYDYSSLPDSMPDFNVRSENANRKVNRLTMIGSFVVLF